MTFECYSVPRSTPSMLHLRCVHTNSVHSLFWTRVSHMGVKVANLRSEEALLPQPLPRRPGQNLESIAWSESIHLECIPFPRSATTLTFPYLSILSNDPEVLNRQGATSWRLVLLVCLFWKGELRAAREVGLGSQCLCPHSLLLPSGHLPPLRDEPFQLVMHSPPLLQDALRCH